MDMQADAASCCMLMINMQRGTAICKCGEGRGLEGYCALQRGGAGLLIGRDAVVSYSKSSRACLHVLQQDGLTREGLLFEVAAG